MNTIKDKMKKRYQAEAALIAKHGTLSARKLATLLFSEYGIKVSHMQVFKDLQQDIESLSSETIKNKKSHILNSIEELANDAFNIAKTDPDSKVRLKAMSVYNKIIETNATVLQKFEVANMERLKAERPVYKIYIGQPKKVKEVKENDEKKE